MRIDPTTAITRLENTALELERIEQKLDVEMSRGYHVSREWPVEMDAAVGQLRTSATMLRGMGGTLEAIAGEVLLDHVPTVGAFAGELRTAYESHDRFGPHHAEWTTRLETPIRDVRAAIELLRGEPARP